MDDKSGGSTALSWSSCVAARRRALDAGERRAIAFFGAVRVARMPAGEVATFGSAEQLFMNVNSPAELTLAERYASTPDVGDRRIEETR